jgi:hypothetical protein
MAIVEWLEGNFVTGQRERRSHSGLQREKPSATASTLKPLRPC